MLFLIDVSKSHSTEVVFFFFSAYVHVVCFRPVESYEEGAASAASVWDRERYRRVAQHSAQVSAAHPVQVSAENAYYLFKKNFLKTSFSSYSAAWWVKFATLHLNVNNEIMVTALFKIAINLGDSFFTRRNRVFQ